MPNKPKDQEKDEDDKRRDKVLERMLKTPHKPHKPDVAKASQLNVSAISFTPQSLFVGEAALLGSGGEMIGRHLFSTRTNVAPSSEFNATSGALGDAFRVVFVGNAERFSAAFGALKDDV